MKFREKASALTLCAVLLGTSLVPVSAATKTEIIGADRYETAAKIADRMGNYNTAILVNADKTLADGLSASSLAGKENAPILLVKRDSIPASTMQRLKKVKKVIIIGGEAAVSNKVVDSLGEKTYIRIEGRDRVETSENVASLVGNYDKAFIVNGNKGEADAMSVASVAARDKAPIILTNGNSSNHEKRSGVKYYVVGGNAVVSNSLVNKFGAVRLSGSDRYKTNRVVVNKFYPNSSKLYFTKGNLLVDALTASPLAKDNGVVLVSANSDNSILNGKDTVQVGGMNFGGNINKPNGDSNKPNNEQNKPNGENNKPDGNKPNSDNKPGGDNTQKPNPDENKPGGGTQKPEGGNKPGGEVKPPAKNTAPKLTAKTTKVVITLGEKLDLRKFGVTAKDEEEGDITSRIEFLNLPKVDVVGTHTFKAKITDKGKLTDTIELTLQVLPKKPSEEVKPPVKNTAPKLTADKTEITLEQDDTINVKAFGLKANDKEDGDISNRISYSTLPSTSKPGTYTFTATVRDNGGLTDTITLKVIVKERKPLYDVNSAEYQRRARDEFGRLLTDYRAIENKKAIKTDERAEKLALLKVKHMIDNKYFDHKYEGKNIHAIYPDVEGEGTGSLIHDSENLYMNYGLELSPEALAKDVFDTWVGSPDHNPALLYNNSDCFGFAVGVSPKGTVYAAYHIGSYRD